MKLILLFIILFFPKIFYGQITKEKQIVITLDSIKQQVMSNLPLYGTDTGKSSTRHHPITLKSPMFIINSFKGQYFYQFYYPCDSSSIKEFFAEYFKPGLIKEISILTSGATAGLFGAKADGSDAIYIILNKKAKFNPQVGGITTIIKKNKKYYGSNCDNLIERYKNCH